MEKSKTSNARHKKASDHSGKGAAEEAKRVTEKEAERKDANVVPPEKLNSANDE
jgi:hypothetical protein